MAREEAVKQLDHANDPQNALAQVETQAVKQLDHANDPQKALAHFENKLDQAVAQLDHANDPQKALAHFENKLEHMPGVNVFVDDPAVHTEEFIGTDGQHDVFVFDASFETVNVALLRNFDAGEDYMLFANMDGRDLIIGDMGEWSNGDPIGFNAVLFHDNGASANIVDFGVPYEQEVIEHTILGFNGHLVFDDPFAKI